MASGFAVAVLEPGTDALLLTGTALVLGAPLAIRVARRRFDVFEPIVFFAVAYGVMFVVRPAADLATGTSVYSIADVGIGIKDTYTEMLVLALVGAVAFVVTYELSYARQVAPVDAPAYRYRPAVLIACALALTLLGLLCFGAYVYSVGGVGALPTVLEGRSQSLRVASTGITNYFLNAQAVLVPAALVILAVAFVQKRIGLFLLSLLPALLLVLFAGPSGGRIVMLPLLLGAATLYYTMKGRRPTLVSVLAVACVGLVVSGIIQEARNVEKREVVGLGHLISEGVKPNTFLRPILEGQDAAMAPALAAMLTIVPEQLPFKYGGATIGDLLVRPIPRPLWDAKPLPPRVEVISVLWPTLATYRVANPEFSTLSVFYLDAGGVGVFVGLALYGAIFRRLYIFYRRRDGALVGRLVLAVGLPLTVISLRDGPVDSFMRAVFILGPIPLVLYLARYQAVVRRIVRPQVRDRLPPAPSARRKVRPKASDA